MPRIVDGGATGHGLESTSVAVTGGEIRLLRPGPISNFGVPVSSNRSEAIEAPGQLASHYAPLKPLRLDAVDERDGEWLIGFGDIAGDSSLSRSGDLVEAAAALFDRLHEAEASARAATSSEARRVGKEWVRTSRSRMHP